VKTLAREAASVFYSNAQWFKVIENYRLENVYVLLCVAM
jgi:hypothetical protein